MGLKSLYESGPEEIDLFGIIDPDLHPETDNEVIAEEESARLSSDSYDDAQEEFDKQADTVSVSNLIETMQSLSPEAIAELARFIRHLQ